MSFKTVLLDSLKSYSAPSPDYASPWHALSTTPHGAPHKSEGESYFALHPEMYELLPTLDGTAKRWHIKSSPASIPVLFSPKPPIGDPEAGTSSIPPFLHLKAAKPQGMLAMPYSDNLLGQYPELYHKLPHPETGKQHWFIRGATQELDKPASLHHIQTPEDVEEHFHDRDGTPPYSEMDVNGLAYDLKELNTRGVPESATEAYWEKRVNGEGVNSSNFKQRQLQPGNFDSQIRDAMLSGPLGGGTPSGVRGGDYPTVSQMLRSEAGQQRDTRHRIWDLGAKGLSGSETTPDHTVKTAGQQRVSEDRVFNALTESNNPHFDSLMGEYVEKTSGEDARFIVHGDTWTLDRLAQEQPGYGFRRYTPRDHLERVKREDAMGVGRTTYGALGWDCPPMPVIRGPIQQLGVEPEAFDGQSQHRAFGAEPYGQTRLVFAGSTLGNSAHSVDDSYSDSRYCPDGGWRAALANASSFAYRNIKDGSRFALKPNYGDNGPQFLELQHRGDMSWDKLETAYLPLFQFPDNPRESGEWKRLLFPGHHDQFKSKAEFQVPKYLLNRTPAKIKLLPLNSSYHPESLGLVGFKSPLGIDELQPVAHHTRWAEQEATDHLDRARDTLDRLYGDRVSLVLPEWYKRRNGI